MDFNSFITSPEFDSLEEKDKGEAIREFYNKAAIQKAEEFDAVSANRLKERGEQIAVSYNLRSQAAFGPRAWRKGYENLANINDQRIKLSRDLESGNIDKFNFLQEQAKLTLDSMESKQAVFENNADLIEEASRLYVQSGLSGLVDDSVLKNKDALKIKFDEVMSQLPEEIKQDVRDNAKIKFGTFQGDFATTSLGELVVGKPSIWFDTEDQIRERIRKTGDLNKLEKERLLSEVSERRQAVATATLDSLSEDMAKYLATSIRVVDPDDRTQAIIDGKLRDELAGDTDTEKLDSLVKEVRQRGFSGPLRESAEVTSRGIFNLISNVNRPFLSKETNEEFDRARQEGTESLQRIVALQDSILGDDSKILGVKASSLGGQLPILLMAATTGGLGLLGRAGATRLAGAAGLGARGSAIAGRLGFGAGAALPFGALETFNQFNEARFSDDPNIRARAKELALKAGITEAFITGAFSAIGLGGLEKSSRPVKEVIKGTAKDRFLRNLGSRVAETAKQTGSEILEESIIQVANTFLVEAEKNPNFTVGQFKESLKETAMTAGLITLTKRTPVDALTTVLDAADKTRKKDVSERAALHEKVKQDLIDSGNADLVEQMETRGAEIRRAQADLERRQADEAVADTQQDFEDASLTNEEIDQAVADIDRSIKSEPDTEIVNNLQAERESLLSKKQEAQAERVVEPVTQEDTNQEAQQADLRPSNLTEAIGKGIANLILSPILKSQKKKIIESKQNANTFEFSDGQTVDTKGLDKAANQNLPVKEEVTGVSDDVINGVLEKTFGVIPENVQIVTNAELPGVFADVNESGIRINKDLVSEDNVGLKLDHELGHIAYNQSQEVRDNFSQLFDSLPEADQNKIISDVSQVYSQDLQGEESRVAALEAVRNNAASYKDKPFYKRLVDSIKDFFAKLFGRDTERSKAFDADALAEKILGLGAAKLIEAQTDSSVQLVEGQRQAKKPEKKEEKKPSEPDEQVEEGQADAELEKLLKQKQKRALKSGDKVKVTQAFSQRNVNDTVEEQQPIIDEVAKQYPFLQKEPTEKSVDQSKQVLVKLATDRGFVKQVEADTGSTTGVEALVSMIVNHAAQYYKATRDKSFSDLAFALSADIEITTNIGDAMRRARMRGTFASKISLYIGEYQNGLAAWVHSNYLKNAVKDDGTVKNFGTEAQAVINKTQVDKDAVSTEVGEKTAEKNKGDIEKTIEGFAKLHSDTPQNVKRKTSELQKLVKEHLKIKDADGNKFDGLSETDFIKRVIDLGFERQAGKRLYDILQKERNAKKTVSNTKAAKAIAKLNGKKAAEFILESPYLTFENEDKRREFAEKQLIDKGFSPEEAKQFAKLFDQEFSNSLVESRVKEIQKLISSEKSWSARITEKKLSDVRKAIRLGVKDPRFGIAETILAQGNWDGITQSQFDRMVEIDNLLLADDELSAHEKANLLKEMGNILADVDVPLSVLEMFIPAWIMSTLSGVTTLILQFASGTINQIAGLGTTIISGFETGWKDGVDNAVLAMGEFVKMQKFQFREMLLAWRDDAYANRKAEELELSNDKLMRGLREGWRDMFAQNRTSAQRAEASAKVFLGINALTSRTLGSIDQGYQRGWKRFIEVTQGSKILKKAGIPKSEIKTLLNHGASAAQKYADIADERGYEGIRKNQFVAEMAHGSMIQAFSNAYARVTGDGGLKFEQLQDMGRIEGQMLTGTHDYEDGIFPSLVRAFDEKVLKPFPILRLLIPILKTPAQTTHRNLWFSPVGALRILKLGGLNGLNLLSDSSTEKFLSRKDEEKFSVLRMKNYKTNVHTETLKYEEQWSLRRSEAVLGTILTAVAAVWHFGNDDEEEAERKFGVYSEPPSNKSDRQNWEENGGRRNTFFFPDPITGGRVYGRWDRGALEPFQHTFILLAAIQKSNDYANADILSSLAVSEGFAFFESLNAIERNSGFFKALMGKADTQTSTPEQKTAMQKIFGSSKFGSKAGKALGYKAAPIIPLSALLRTVNKLADKREVGTFQEGFMSAVPVFGGFAGKPALNELGDPVTANESGVMEKLGVSFFFADPGRKKDIYKEFSKRNYWPSQTSRRSFDKKYGELVTQEVYYDFGKLRGKEIEKGFNSKKSRLQKIDDEKFRKEMSTIIREATERAARKLKLKPLKKK